jgi:hypothetical protein
MRLATLFLVAATSLVAQAPTPKLAALPDLSGGVAVRGKYVALLVGTNKEHVSPGGTITLMVRATPGPKMHVYAPGQQGYTPVTLTLEKNVPSKDAAYRASSVLYPKPTLFEFAPLNEKVKVYDAPFTVTQPITLAATPALRQRASAGDTLIVNGSFAYQACDDTICYRPETLAVEWKMLMSMLGSRP